MSWFKEKRVKDRSYLDWLSKLPCLVNKSWDETVAGHHTRDKHKGMATKSSDSSAVPLSHENHMELHRIGSDDKYFEMHGIDYKTMRKCLYEIYLDNSPDRDDKAKQLIRGKQ